MRLRWSQSRRGKPPRASTATKQEEWQAIRELVRNVAGADVAGNTISRTREDEQALEQLVHRLEKEERHHDKREKEGTPAPTAATEASRTTAAATAEQRARQGQDEQAQKKGEQRQRPQKGQGERPQRSQLNEHEQTGWQKLWQVRVEDVTAPVMTILQVQDECEKLRTAGTTGQPLKLAVQVEDEEEIDTLEVLINMYDFLRILRIRGLPPGETPRANETRRQLPGRVKGRQEVRLRNVAIWRSHADSPELKSNKLNSRVIVQAMPTTVIEISAEKRYAEQTWERVRKAPGEMARKWAGEFLDRETTRTLRDTFRPLEAEDKSSITLLWRVENTAIPALLAQSGRRSPSGLRFFTKPGPLEAPAPPPYRCCYKDKRMQDETWEQYADRIYEASGVLGVARGPDPLAPDGREAWTTETDGELGESKRCR